MKLYSNSSNCMRAAKVALGAGAVRDVHFTIAKREPTEADPGMVETGFFFTAIEGAPPVPAAEAKPAKVASKRTVVKPAKVAKVKAAKVERRKPAAKPKRERKPSDGTVGHQPSYQALLALMSRANGVTVEDAKTRLNVEPHTARGMFSRISKEYKIDKVRVNQKMVYSNPRKLSAAARSAIEEAAGLGVVA